MSKPQNLNELQVERVMDLWWEFLKSEFGIEAKDEMLYQGFINWLESR